MGNKDDLDQHPIFRLGKEPRTPAADAAPATEEDAAVASGEEGFEDLAGAPEEVGEEEYEAGYEDEAFYDEGVDGGVAPPVPGYGPDVAPGPRGGGTMLLGGGLLAVAAIVLGGLTAAVPQMAAVTAFLDGTGIGTGGLLVAGVVLLVGGVLQRHAGGTGDETTGTRTHMASQLDYLVEAQGIRDERPPASGEELDRVLLVLQRQDEKINNLTRAIKMYGKPLIEISNGMSDVLTQLRDLHSAVETGVSRLVEGHGSLSATLAEQGGAAESGRNETRRAVLELGERITEWREEGTDDGRDDRLAASIERNEQAIATLREELDRTVGDNLDRLEKRLEESTGRMAADLEKVLRGAGEDSGLEDSVRTIQRELAGLGTTLASIQSRIGQGGAGAPAPAPAGAGGDAPSGGGGGGSGALANSISGTKTAKNKNVLGAIAKLKSMRN